MNNEPKPIVLSKWRNEKLALSIYSMASWEDFDSIVQWLKQEYGAVVLEKNDGCGAREWTLKIKGHQFSFFHDDLFYNNALYACSENDEAALYQIGIDLEERLKGEVVRINHEVQARISRHEKIALLIFWDSTGDITKIIYDALKKKVSFKNVTMVGFSPSYQQIEIAIEKLHALLSELRGETFSIQKKAWILRLKDSFLEWLELYWDDLVFRFNSLPWYRKPFISLEIINWLVKVRCIKIHIFPKKFKTWFDFLSDFDRTVSVLADNQEIRWENRLTDALTSSHSSTESIQALKAALKHFSEDKISKKLNLRKVAKRYLAYLKRLDDIEDVIYQDDSIKSLKVKKAARSGALLYRVSKTAEQAVYGSCWTLNRPTVASFAATYHMDIEKMPPLYMAIAALKLNAIAITRKMPILNNHLLEDEDIIILNRDEDVLSIISVDPLF